jgi:hypothetical protein
MRKNHRPLQNALLKGHNPFHQPHKESQQAGQHITLAVPGRQEHSPNYVPGEQQNVQKKNKDFLSYFLYCPHEVSQSKPNSKGIGRF